MRRLASTGAAGSSLAVRSVTRHDLEAVVEALVSAFAGDPLIGFLFGEDWQQKPHVGAFFRILLEVRVSLGMPAFCAQEGGVIVGAVMGYDTSRPTWEEEQTEKWTQLLAEAEGLESRLREYGNLADKFEPARPHYYLGVLGVRADQQGSGIGGALLERFCAASSSNANSSGVYLETASEASLRFYLKNGFEVRGEGRLGDNTSLWCVFRATGPRAA
jgi:GNAT superfamily N-acetyltransferase